MPPISESAAYKDPKPHSRRSYSGTYGVAALQTSDFRWEKKTEGGGPFLGEPKNKTAVTPECRSRFPRQ